MSESKGQPQPAPVTPAHATPAHVTMVTLGVSDLRAATAFYEQLGWRRASASTDGIAFMIGGGITLGLFLVFFLCANLCLCHVLCCFIFG